MKLGNMPDMKKRWSYPVGLSDHSFGSLGAVVGVTLGACVVEKHVKLAGVESADSEFSMSMEEFAAMVSDCRNAKLIAAGPDYGLTENEKASTVFRRSIYCASEIKAGETFTQENIRVVRPGYGLKPKYYEQLIGRKAKRDIHFGDRIVEEDLQEAEDLL